MKEIKTSQLIPNWNKRRAKSISKFLHGNRLHYEKYLCCDDPTLCEENKQLYCENCDTDLPLKGNKNGQS